MDLYRRGVIGESYFYGMIITVSVLFFVWILSLYYKKKDPKKYRFIIKTFTYRTIWQDIKIAPKKQIKVHFLVFFIISFLLAIPFYSIGGIPYIVIIVSITILKYLGVLKITSKKLLWYLLLIFFSWLVLLMFYRFIVGT